MEAVYEGLLVQSLLNANAQGGWVPSTLLSSHSSNAGPDAEGRGPGL